MEVDVVIDGIKIELLPRGLNQGFQKFVAPKQISGVVANVFLRPDWKQKNRITRGKIRF